MKKANHDDHDLLDIMRTSAVIPDRDRQPDTRYRWPSAGPVASGAE